MEPKPIYAAPIVYRERGAFLRRFEKFNKAKVSYDTAYNYKQDDVRMLTGRSHVCIDTVQPIQAYEDAELALKLEPQNMTACIMRARALYTMSEFERSLVMHYRGARRRRLPRYFLEGIGQGIETIQDSIGKNAGPVMTDFRDLIKRNQSAYIDENQPENLLHISRIPHLETKAKLTQLEARKQVILSRVMAMKYLGSMAWDKFFLQELSSATFKSKTINSANAISSQDLNELVDKTLQMLSERQEMLRVQRPFYAIVHTENSVSRYQNKFREQLLNNERKAGAHTASLYLKQILMCFIQNKIIDLNAKAERMQIFLDSKTPRTLPNKEHYTDKLYTLVGEAYLSQYRLSYDLQDNGNRRRVAFLLGLPISRPISYDSVIYNYPHKRPADLQEALGKMMNTLQTCENSLRKCWITCTIARLLTAQKNYSLSKYYAKLCQDEATKIENGVWWLNGCFVILSGDMQQGNVNDVRTKVEEAYHWAKLLKNSERVLAFLAKCAEMAAEPITADCKTILQRETGILKVIDNTLRLETEVLFRRISMVPSRRRFSVVPCKSKLRDERTARQKRRQRGLSIIPGKEQHLPRPPVSKVMGFQIFDI